jgi:hypothetical protein
MHVAYYHYTAEAFLHQVHFAYPIYWDIIKKKTVDEVIFRTLKPKKTSNA